MIFKLLIIYQTKHSVCNYLLQGKFMLGKFGKWSTIFSHYFIIWQLVC